MIIARTAAELRAAVSGPCSFVPTMGALHDGHASLIRLAAEHPEPVVVSDFVNPTQFGVGEDFKSYPRDLVGDAALAAAAGAAVLYAPDVDEVYPPGFVTTVDPGPLSRELCGASRPGHFVGVATVVTRLYGLVRPTRVVFGRKDYQQLTLMRRVAKDLALGIDVIGAPTIREADGLAMSSRNRFLSADQRAEAVAIPRLLAAIAEAYASGERNPTALLLPTHALPSTLELEYLELRAADLSPYDPAAPAVALIACRLGATRLIDNLELDPADPTAAGRTLDAKEPA